MHKNANCADMTWYSSAGNYFAHRHENPSSVNRVELLAKKVVTIYALMKKQLSK